MFALQNSATSLPPCPSKTPKTIALFLSLFELSGCGGGGGGGGGVMQRLWLVRLWLGWLCWRDAAAKARLPR